MDAVELPLPAAVAMSKLLTGEGVGRTKATMEEEEIREPDRVSILGSPSSTGCSSSTGRKEVNSVSRHRKADAEILKQESKFPDHHSENISGHCRDSNNLLLHKCESKQLHRKGGKVPRSCSPCSKRPRTEQPENPMTQDGIVISEKLASGVTKCTSTEKSRVIKQKHSLDGKRGDRRNSKAAMKTKFDSFFSKAGFIGSNSAAGGNNLLGTPLYT